MPAPTIVQRPFKLRSLLIFLIAILITIIVIYQYQSINFNNFYSFETQQQCSLSSKKFSFYEKEKNDNCIWDSSCASVLVLTPIKDNSDKLDHYFEQLDRLEYDHTLISVAFLEGNSRDDERIKIREKIEAYAHNNAKIQKVELYKADFDIPQHSAESRHDLSFQTKRRSVMAKSRNFLVAQALRDHDWVLWIDVDVDDYPPESLKEMMNIRKDIVVPNCVMPDGNTYDRNTYKGGDEAAINMYFPPGEIIYNGYYPLSGRKFGVEMKEEGDIVEVDGVGGVLLLVRGDVHRSGAYFLNYFGREQ